MEAMAGAVWGIIVSFTLACWFVSATEVAASVTCKVPNKPEGERYVTVFAVPVGAAQGFDPVAQTWPEVESPFGVPLTVQVTPVFVVPVTVAVKLSSSPEASVALIGESWTRTPESRVTVAVAVAFVSALLVAVTVTVFGLIICEGAVYRPLESIVPQPVPLQLVPVTLQLTVISLGPLTIAENCWVPPKVTTACSGERVTVVVVLLPPQPERIPASKTANTTER